MHFFAFWFSAERKRVRGACRFIAVAVNDLNEPGVIGEVSAVQQLQVLMKQLIEKSTRTLQPWQDPPLSFCLNWATRVTFAGMSVLLSSLPNRAGYAILASYYHPFYRRSDRFGKQFFLGPSD